MWDIMKHIDIHVMGNTREEREKKKSEEIIAENFPELLIKQ